MFHIFLKYLALTGITPSKEEIPFWKEQLNLLQQGIRDGRCHDNSLVFSSWYSYNYGEEV
jgi:hypothetical protein